MRLALLASSLLLAAGAAHAATFGFVSNPTGNSSDWAADVANRGGTVNSAIDFEAHSTGTLVSDFYSLTEGVTLTAAGDVNTVINSAGPGQGNTSSAPKSPGEGVNPVSNVLFDGGGVSSLTIDFAAPVIGFGLHVIDYFNPTGSNPLRIEAFAGAGGTGLSLGLFDSVAFNFQENYRYFMGLTSDAADIRSVVFSDLSTATGDTIALDDFVFASSGTVTSPIPVPAALPLLMGALGGLALLRRRT